MNDLISKLSEIRSQYNCFNESEEPYYRALSKAIKVLSGQADGDTISRRAAIDIVVFECGKWTGLAKEISKQLKQLPSAQLDTIPVEWIQRYADDWEDMNYPYDNPILGMLEDWRGE